MGRWQSEYYDQVLGQKLKTLVCGAIARATLEKDDPQAAPSISYESFVQDLDHGDSFTTTLVDILVKELAERKTRPSSTDRHLIAERTAQSLGRLTRSRIYYDRSSRRSYVNDFFVSHTGGGATTLDWDVLTQNADDEDIDVEDDATNPGIHRYNPAEPAYHPLTQPSSSNTAIRRSLPVQTADPGTDDDSPLPLGYPTRRSPPAHLSMARHSSLSRQPSIRRPVRSRTSDFNEFTSRRRPSGRHDQSSQSGLGSTSRASVSNTGESSSSMDIANLLHNHGGNEDADGAMHVATFASTSTANALTRRGLMRVRSSDERDGSGGESTSSTRFSPFALHTSGSSTSAAPSSSRLHINAPRLRRGGVRAPEQYVAAGPAAGDGYTHTVRISSPPIPGLHTLPHRTDEQRLPLPRRSSSAEMEYIIQTASERFGSRSPRSGSPLLLWTGNWNGPPEANGGTVSASSSRQQIGTTPTNLPTPRSISPEDSSAP